MVQIQLYPFESFQHKLAYVRASLRTDTFSSNVSFSATVGYVYAAYAELSSQQSGSIYVVSGGTLLSETGTGWSRIALIRATSTTVTVRSTNAYGFWNVTFVRIY